MKYSSILLLSLSLVGSTAFAGDDTRAAIGGALGGVLGSVVGDAVGGSTGAAIGSGIGGAAGGAVGAGRGNKTEAAIGGGLGAAGGNVIGRQIGGSTGGLIGAALGGAGGGALKLLQMSGIPEAEGYAGFPVGGSFLATTNPDVVKRHLAKVYGKASVGSPPMSVPHLDTRMIDGKPVLLFGPFATFSTKFLKNGSLWDLPGSVTSGNIGPMFNAGIDNFDLSQYLIGQLMLSQDDRMASLREYFPEARDEDWKLVQAGQRVQIIKKDAEKGGVLQFGTEVVTAADGSVAALLGASPGASTAAPIMLSVLEKAFKDKVATPEWQARLKEIVPSYGRKLNNDIELTNSTRAWSSERLQLIHVPVQPEA